MRQLLIVVSMALLTRCGMSADSLYCVVDLSGGICATNFPVSNLDSAPPEGWTDEYKTTKLVLRRIEAGSFKMKNRYDVTLTKPFYVGVFEVTQKQWELVMGTRPSYFKNDSYYASRPVEQVSYDMIRGESDGGKWPATKTVDAISFLGRLREKTGLDFDLPTEAQWEYACRAGTMTDYNNGTNYAYSERDSSMDVVGRYSYNGGRGGISSSTTSEGTAKVGSYVPNSWGLYDMHGNVREFCLDWYEGGDTFADSDRDTCRVLRGGGWLSNAGWCTSTYTYEQATIPSKAYYHNGFRIVRTLDEDGIMGGLAEASSDSVSVDTTFQDGTCLKTALVIAYGSVNDSYCRIIVNDKETLNTSENGVFNWMPTIEGENKLVYFSCGITMEVTVIKRESEILTFAEVLDESKLTEVVTGGDSAWMSIEDATAIVGGSCAVSGCLDDEGDEESTWLKARVYGRGTLSFYWRVSCEPDPQLGRFACDYAAFEVEDEIVERIDGKSDWISVVRTFETDEWHEIRWSYNSDGYRNQEYGGCVWVDGVTWSDEVSPKEFVDVTFDANGGSPSLSVISIERNTVVGELPIPVREDYDFCGWFTSAENGEPITPATKIVAGTTFYAHWLVKKMEDAILPGGFIGLDCDLVVSSDWVTGDLVNRYGDGKDEVFVSMFGHDFSMALFKKTGKHDGGGREMYVWEDYVAGTDPTDTGSVFRASLTIKDGCPVVEWDPNLNSNKVERVYKVYGKANLADEKWGPTNEMSRFFKVAVSMPGTDELTVADALDAPGLTFQNEGDAAWGVQTAVSHDGVASARSGKIGANQSSSICAAVTGPATVSFWWKVSSEAIYDFLEFLVDGQQMDEISGMHEEWVQVTQIIDVGTHVLKWNYHKDYSVDNGDDCGWIDQLSVVPFEACTVTFNANGGSCATQTKSCWRGMAYGALPVATHDGFAFEGWYTGKDSGQKVTPTTVASGNITLYAHWAQVSLSVSGLLHRWSFNGDLKDSVGGSDAVAVGTVSSDGSVYTLSGGSDTVAYIDLGTGLFADGVTEFTIETWATPYVTGWMRIWDMADQFGQCWNGKDNLMGVRDHDEWTSYTENVKTYIAVVCTALSSGGWSLVYYHLDAETGATLSSYASTIVGSDWSPQKVGVNALLLGKSHASWDPYGNASYDEFRIWNKALSEGELKKNVEKGPGLLP